MAPLNNHTLKSILLRLCVAATVFLGAFGIALVAFLRFGIYHPRQVETVPVQTVPGAEVLLPGDSLKVLCYNVQYFAGKDYVFFYDMPGFSGPDIRPSPGSIQRTLDEVAAILIYEDADIVLLQEMDDGAARTDRKNQTQALLDRLHGRYAFYAEAFYWRASFVPHPKIMGAVGMKLTTLSKVPIRSATRYQLPRIPGDLISRNFNFCRAILEVRIPWTNTEIAIFNTHFDAFADDPDTMRGQVRVAEQLLADCDREGIPWVIGGDFNLLPPGFMERHPDNLLLLSYNPDSELFPLMRQWRSIPSLADALGPDAARWLTHFPNNPAVSEPDRIIDYLFYSDRLQASEARVIQGHTWKISDHLPIVARFSASSE
jgi:endonuclease/exonuclease/phosphatase family metal-dependent hydrolase